MLFWKKCHRRLGIETKANAADDVEGHKLHVILDVALHLSSLFLENL